MIIAQYVRPHIPVCNDLRVGQKVRIGSSVIEMVMGIQHIPDRLVRYRRNLLNDIGVALGELAVHDHDALVGNQDQHIGAGHIAVESRQEVEPRFLGHRSDTEPPELLLGQLWTLLGVNQSLGRKNQADVDEQLNKYRLAWVRFHSLLLRRGA